jgi:hypothetical protein
MNRAEILRQFGEEKQREQVEKLDRFSQMSVQWERDLGEVLLSMREFQEAVQADTCEQKKLLEDFAALAKKSLVEVGKNQEQQSWRLEQKYEDVVQMSKWSVKAWIITVVAVGILGGVAGWHIRSGWKVDENQILADYLRKASPDLAEKLLLYPELREPPLREEE